MLSLNIDLTALFSQVNTYWAVFWGITIVTLGLPFTLMLVDYVSSSILSAFMRFRGSRR